MIENTPVSVRVPADVLNRLDALLDSERATLPGRARLSRHALVLDLLVLGLNTRREQIAEQRREQLAHDEKRAARLERD